MTATPGSTSGSALRTHSWRKLRFVGAALASAAVLTLGGVASAAGPTPVGLGSATDAAVVSASSPTNAGTSSITGDVTSTDPSQPGFAACPGANCVNYTGGGPHAAPDPVAVNDQAAALAAWVHTSTLSGAMSILPQLGGTTLVAGLYNTGGAIADITGTLTLDAAGDPSSVWIFQTANLTSASATGVVAFINNGGATAAQLACNVYWTTDTAELFGPTFVGTIMANTHIHVRAGVTVTGRLFTNTADVTLIGDTINRPSCTVLPAGTGGVLPTAPGSGAGSAADSGSGSGSGTASSTGLARFTG